MKKATVVIPNYNGEKYLKDCLEALKHQDTDDFEVLIIDNASSDGSVPFIREHYPDFKLMVMEENLGFAGGVNAGIEASETPYVILLNNDTEADPHYVKALIDAMDKDDRIFSVSPKMVQFYHRELLDDAGDGYTFTGWGFQRGVGQKTSDPAYDKPCAVFSSCGGAAAYRKQVFDEIGLFDTAHFAYLEDIDVGWRASIYGYKNVYEPSSVVYHVGSGTSGSKYNDFKVKLAARNNIYLVYKNMTPLQKVINFLPLKTGQAVKRRFFAKEGFLKAYEEGLQEGKEKKHTMKKVPYRISHMGNYLKIEGMLISNMFVYIKEYLKRH